jgi:hypothetical protein
MDPNIKVLKRSGQIGQSNELSSLLKKKDYKEIISLRFNKFHPFLIKGVVIKFATPFFIGIVQFKKFNKTKLFPLSINHF